MQSSRRAALRVTSASKVSLSLTNTTTPSSSSRRWIHTVHNRLRRTHLRTTSSNSSSSLSSSTAHNRSRSLFTASASSSSSSSSTTSTSSSSSSFATPHTAHHYGRAFSSTANDNDNDEEDDDGDFDEVGGLKTADVGRHAGTLDPNNPPSLTYDHYKSLKGIDFTDQRRIRAEVDEAKENEWQEQLEALKDETEKEFKMSAEDMAAIASHKMEDFPEEEIQVEMPEVRGMDDDFAANFGSDDYERAPVEDYFDPAAFPVDLDMGSMVPTKRKGKCIFCLPDPSKKQVKNIDYTNVELLHKFINERGMIFSRRHSYNCAKHQRQVAAAIKRARFIGLLSFTDNFYVPFSFSNFDNVEDIEQVKKAKYHHDGDDK